MIDAIVRWSLQNRGLVLLLSALLAVAGVRAMLTTPLDAIPDLSDVQVIVQAEFAEQAPGIVEDQVTFPISSEMLNVPGARVVRAFSYFGLSLTYVIFEDGTDIYWARSRVLEYLSGLRERLPEGVEPVLGPDATGVGWVLQYALVSDSLDLAELRTLQDWYLRYQLVSVPGVAEVASLGGFVKQYQVELDPERLRAFGVSAIQVARALRTHNADIGARVLELGGREYMIRGLGYLRGAADIEQIPVTATAGGTPIRVADLAAVQIGPAPRRGLAELDGRGEVVSGIIVMRFGADALSTIEAVKTRLAEIERQLPAGTRLVIGYDRSDLIHQAIGTLREKLIEESLIVALVIVVFLLHARSSLVAIVTLPLGVLFAFLAMQAIGVNANIMSLGGIAIAIGAMVDASIVMVENLHTYRERHPDADPWEAVRESARRVAAPIFASLLVITVSFLPVFALEQQEGRLFKPLAYTKTFAMAGAALLSITLVPVLMGYLVRGRLRAEADNPVTTALKRLYAPVLRMALRHPVAVIVSALLVVAVTVLPWRRLGGEFMPPLREGTLLFMPTTMPGVSIAQAGEILRWQDSVLASFPEVRSVLGKAGRAQTATDPAPMEMFETVITLRPESEWRPGMTYERLLASLDSAVRLPGVTNAWTMPIRGRIDMLATGVRTAVGVKIFGPDLDTLQALGERVEQLVRGLPETRSAFAERGVAGYYVDIDVDHFAAARYGLTTGMVHETIMATVGGVPTAVTVEGRERYEVIVRYPRERRADLSDLLEVLIPTEGGAQVPLGQVARVEIVPGPMMVRTENAFPTSTVYIDLAEGADVRGYVEHARDVVEQGLVLPAGYTLAWSGQFESMERVRRALGFLVPLTLGIIALLLYATFRGIGEVLIVLLSVPFAMVGGVWLLWLADYQTSVAVWVGFIALAGVAAETGVVMLIYLDEALRDRRAAGQLRHRADVIAAVEAGALGRLRPKVMTVLTIILGLMPILWSQGTGADVMKRIAAPMVGGMVTSALLTLVVIPAIYLLWRDWQRRTGVLGT
jgi:Cu(I)/Ag(I) efflux system membrane protein CusA/SilA